jgi:Family of unknown function (DUF6314)/Flavin-binding monooxygenase-like
MKWPKETPTFPSLDDMKKYLDDYASKYVLNNKDCEMLLGCTVTSVSSCSSATSSKVQYAVEWEDVSGEVNTKLFDGVVVATGFFSRPLWPEELQCLVKATENESLQTRRVIHSSQYRSPLSYTNQTVAVVGNSFSAHEIASDLRRNGAKRVINIIGDQPTRIPYVVPHYVPSSNGAAFLPIDFVMYQRDRPGPKDTEATLMEEEDCKKRHNLLRSWLGARKLRQAASVGLSMGQSTSSPPLVSISEDFLSLAIDRKIEIMNGRMTTAAVDTTHCESITLQLSDGSIVNGIDSIIACTGYKCGLEYLSPEILASLQYDESDAFSPFIACYDAVHPGLPHLGLIGMYKGQYFGVMELQARLIAGIISGQVNGLSDESFAKELLASEKRRHGTPRAQFPHFDYIGMMDTLAAKLGLAPGVEFGSAGAMVSPLFYQPDRSLAYDAKCDIDDTVRECGDSIGRTVSSALLGRWSFERTIRCKLTASEQRVCGEIKYTLSGPNLECLRYREDGFLELPNGNRLEVFREYEYMLRADLLNIHFIENGEPAHLFLSLRFQKGSNSTWTATSDHLCINDLYKGDFSIKFDGLSATEVSMTYNVKGPNKDYESATLLQPLS